MVSSAPLLAPPSGSVLQFLVMTLPLLGVYLYFLYLAVARPSIADPANPAYLEDRIRLTDILYLYLATIVPFAGLAVYLLWFVGRRHALSRRYEEEAITILGDVEYSEGPYDPGLGCGRARRCCVQCWNYVLNGFTPTSNYGRVVYDLGRVASHPACRDGNFEGVITKRVRVYHRYPREQVSILVLPRHPYSGQPKIDMEADWASFSERVGLDEEGGRRAKARGDRSGGVLAVAAGWSLFLVLASLYVANQISVIDEHYEDEDGRTAWIVFGCMLGLGVPLIAVGGNCLRWKIYENWMLRSGTMRKDMPRRGRGGQEEDNDGSIGGSYSQMGSAGGSYSQMGSAGGSYVEMS